jgi:hypothetical protein
MTSLTAKEGGSRGEPCHAGTMADKTVFERRAIHCDLVRQTFQANIGGRWASSSPSVRIKEMNISQDDV